MLMSKTRDTASTGTDPSLLTEVMVHTLYILVVGVDEYFCYLKACVAIETSREL